MARAGLGMAFRQIRGLFAGGSVSGLEDGQLLARYANSRDERAFEALIERHGPMVLTICRAVLKNEHDSEDAFQATFLVLARKAGSIRGADALGGWLHRVAYRASVQAGIEAANRRRKEAEAQAMAAQISPKAANDQELQTLLHEEINRLPESQRLPIILCDLEGLTYEQAANQLQWTIPTLRNRLARGRQNLKTRLTRQGLMVPAIAGLASVPPSLLKTSLSAATGGAISTGASLLARILLKGMLMTKLKVAGTLVIAACVLISAGLIVASGMYAEDPRSIAKPKPQTALKDLPVRAKPIELIELKGRVVAPDGHAVSGASIRAAFIPIGDYPHPVATSGRDGRFSIRLPKMMPKADAWDGDFTPYPWLVASGPGYGVVWIERVLRADRPEEQVLRLVREGPPLEGRILDIESRPVVGATIKLKQIRFDYQGDFPGWIAKARKGGDLFVWRELGFLPINELLEIETKTGVDGRFRLTGVGQDRIAELQVSGSGIARTPVYVLSRDEPEIRTEDYVINAPKFEVSVAPSLSVEGIARDKETGRPIAGLEIKATASDDNGAIWPEDNSTHTDGEGWYRLDGLHKADAYQFEIKPGKGMPYPTLVQTILAEMPVQGVVNHDLTLKRGIFLRGKITDKITGRPLPGAVSYHAFADNPHIEAYEGITRVPEGDPRAFEADENGFYQLVALPGRGLLSFVDSSYRYRHATGFEKIEGYDSQTQRFLTVPRELFEGNCCIITEVFVDPRLESMTFDLQADPGKSVAIKVVGPDGKPFGGTKVKGMGEVYDTMPFRQESASFQINALDPSKPRRVVVTHEKLKLIGSAVLNAKEAGPIIVKLQPWGAIVGRILDDGSHPRDRMFLINPGGSGQSHPETHDILPGSDWREGIHVGKDGRFRVEGLVPGLKYSANLGDGELSLGTLFEGDSVAPGEIKDLGDLKLVPYKP
jgi:RNA polymerase sigma factor (sigma-70 family)